MGLVEALIEAGIMTGFHRLGRKPCARRIRRRLMPREAFNSVLVLEWKLLHAFWVGIGTIPYRPPAHSLTSLLKQPSPACCLPRLQRLPSPHQGYATQDRASGQWSWGHSQAGFSAWRQSDSSARNRASGRRASNYHRNPSQGRSRVFALMGSRVRVHKPLGTAGLHGRRGYLLAHLLIPLHLPARARELPGAPTLPHRWGREKATSRSLPT